MACPSSCALIALNVVISHLLCGGLVFWIVSRCLLVPGELVLEMEDLVEHEESLVWLSVAEVGEELSHLGLPAAVDLRACHSRLRVHDRRCLDVADQESVTAEEQRVVVPTRRCERLQHLGPDRRVAFAVFRDAIGLDLELEADALHHRAFHGEGGPGRRGGDPPAGHLTTQKSKSPMLSLLNWYGSPSRTVASSPNVNSPSLPALKVSPSLPVMSPSARAFAAHAAR